MVRSACWFPIILFVALDENSKMSKICKIGPQVDERRTKTNTKLKIVTQFLPLLDIYTLSSPFDFTFTPAGQVELIDDVEVIEGWVRCANQSETCSENHITISGHNSN